MYVLINFNGSNSRFRGDFDLGLIVVAWPIEETKKNENAAHLDARRPCFRALCPKVESGARGRPQFTYVHLYIVRICTFQTSRPAQYERIAPKIAACDPRGSIC